MLAETEKIINGKYKHKRKLGIVFSLYKCFNKIVSVAKHTRDLNAENLAHYVDANKMVYVHNSLNVEKIIDSVENHGFSIESYEGQDHIIQKEEKPGIFSMKGIRLPKHNEINFVNMGRLSPEKDQEKLIKAFSQLINKYKNLKMKLYIIGDGILKETLSDLVETLGVEESVIFTGQMKNPFFLINKADCFVLSSNHEGQPMVLLETLVLNKPIIATDIAGSRSILEDGYGTLAPNNVDGLFSEMEKFVLDNSEDKGSTLNKDLNYNRRFKRFNYEDYNQQAMKMFYREVCSEEV